MESLAHHGAVEPALVDLLRELLDLERQELALEEQQDRAEQARLLAEEAFAIARDFDRLVAAGTIDEKRTLIRAFLRRLDLDPETEAGTASFWLLPGGGGDGREFRPEGGGADAGADEGEADGDSSFQDEAPDPASPKKDAPPESDASSFRMVAGAGFEPATFGL